MCTALAAVLVAAAAGCAGRYGSVRFDATVGRAFEAGEVMEGFRYYTTGSETDPAAILALRDDRPLRPGPWREVAMTPELLKRLVERMRSTRFVGPDGHLVLDANGSTIGSWCSYFRPPIVRLLDDGTVEVSTPFASSGDGSNAARPEPR